MLCNQCLGLHDCSKDKSAYGPDNEFTFETFEQLGEDAADSGKVARYGGGGFVVHNLTHDMDENTVSAARMIASALVTSADLW